MAPLQPRPSRRSLLLAGAALAAAPAFAQTPRRGGSMTIGLVAEPTTLVSLTNVFTPSLSVSAKVTEGLLTYDQEINPRPSLATEWTVSPDGLRYVFKLRPGVIWHDGKPFTAADVAFSLETIKKSHPRGRSTFANVTAIATPDPLTVELTLSQPAPYLIKALNASETPIIPKHRYEGMEPTASPNNTAPIGTGPFRFKEWVRGSHVIYERNPDYWDQPKPYLDQLVVRFIPDAAARSAAWPAAGSAWGSS